MKKYQITISEEQLKLVAHALEDWSRFLCGQCELHHATSMLDNYTEIKELMDKVKPFVTPQLSSGESYGWNGGHCPNDRQRKAIAMSYYIYREILHKFAIESNDNINVYNSETLRCAEQGDSITIQQVSTDYGGNTDYDGNFVDLGLPSGTLWKETNEAGFHTYDEAVQRFGDNLPSREQFEELQTLCQWDWIGDGMKVTGPNGNSIVLPAAGSRSCSGDVSNVGSYGYYWSSTPDGSVNAWRFYFDSGNEYLLNYGRCFGYSVRLVQD